MNEPNERTCYGCHDTNCSCPQATAIKNELPKNERLEALLENAKPDPDDWRHLNGCVIDDHGDVRAIHHSLPEPHTCLSWLSTDGKRHCHNPITDSGRTTCLELIRRWEEQQKPREYRLECEITAGLWPSNRFIKLPDETPPGRYSLHLVQIKEPK